MVLQKKSVPLIVEKGTVINNKTLIIMETFGTYLNAYSAAQRFTQQNNTGYLSIIVSCKNKYVCVIDEMTGEELARFYYLLVY